MTRNWNWLSILFVVVSAVSPAAADGPAVITVEGSASARRLPNLVRLTIDVVAQGKDRSEALQKLELRKQELVSKLSELGADSSSVKLGEPTMMTGRFVVKQYLGGQPAPAGLPPQLPSIPPVTNNPAVDAGRPPQQQRLEDAVPYVKSPPTQPILGFSATADFPLPPGDEESATAARILQERIEAADLGGLRGLSEGTACETCGGKAGAPYYSFISRPSDAEAADLYRRAFQSARDAASRWAAASGGTLGPVQSIVHTAKPSPANVPTPAGGPPFRTGEEDVPPSNLEITTILPLAVEHRLRVTVSFVLQTETK